MKLLHHLLGVLITALFTGLTLMVFIPLLPLALVKRVVPYAPWQAHINRCLDWLASHWMSANKAHQQILLPTQIERTGDWNLQKNEWYMLVANHQSWVDILVLLREFNGRIPYLKFFLKQSLIWVPFLGIAWWALDFPFMRRYTKAQLLRNPSLKGKDIEETRKSCEKFRSNPVTIINFLEGTRRTPTKHLAQGSAYQHLLEPKAGGLAFTLNAMNGQLHALLDVTIYYPDGVPSYWDYVCGRAKRIQVNVKQLPLTPDLLGNYGDDQMFRSHFQAWVNHLWKEKDEQLARMGKNVK